MIVNVQSAFAGEGIAQFHAESERIEPQQVRQDTRRTQRHGEGIPVHVIKIAEVCVTRGKEATSVFLKAHAERIKAYAVDD